MENNSLESDWVAQLAVGDPVILAGGYNKEIGKVSRFTKRYVFVTRSSNSSEIKFGRADGWESGSRSVFDRIYLQPYDSSVVKEISLSNIQRRLTSRFTYITRQEVKALTLEQCKLLLETLDKYGLG